ncbi:MAG: penicillin acylase family protein, partial [Bdellovibrionales bacterium]|nr:penicillin acylase family protein [Bdellovibrionales bacterium]
DTMSVLFKMGRARSMDEFKQAVSLGKAPGLNILYADKTNIGWWMFGEIWNKRLDLKTDFILDGASGKDEILSIMPFDKKPFLENPENGVIISANSRPSTYPANMRGDWQPDDRYKTIDQVLSQKEKWSSEELMEVQSLSMNFENKVLLERLLLDTFFDSEAEKASFKKYLDILKNWDLVSSIDSVGASLYYTWTKELQVRMLSALTDDEKEIFSRFPNGWIVFRRLVMDRDSLWWKKFDRGLVFKETLKKAIAQLEGKLGSDPVNWQWGKLHTIEFVHPIGRMKPLDKIFNVGPFPIPGATAEVNNQKFNSYKDFQVKAGPSTRRIIDFAHPQKSWGILPVGNSGHMLSPFFDDQVQLFIKGEYRAQLMDLEDSDIHYKMIVNPK